MIRTYSLNPCLLDMRRLDKMFSVFVKHGGDWGAIEEAQYFDTMEATTKYMNAVYEANGMKSVAYLKGREFMGEPYFVRPLKGAE